MLNKFPLIIVDESTDARIAAALKEAGYEHLNDLLNAFSVLNKKKLRIRTNT